MKKNIPILLMGIGNVGRQLLDHIIACRSLHSKQGLSLRVLGICDSSSLVVVNDVFNMELDDSFLNRIISAKASGYSLSDLSDDGLVIVDCSASTETILTLKQAVDHGCCMVLANKKPLACSIEDHEKLMSEFRRIRFESTVGAGLPIIASVTRILASGDTIFRIVGSLSGTLGYVMSELEDDKAFSKVVQAAKSLGFTEPDPRDDLSGIDVARKALILARLLGQKIDMADIKVESLYPDELGPNCMSTEEFISDGLPSIDSSFSERIRAASEKGNVLRYVCMIEGSRCVVGLQELPKSSPLGRLKGSDNVVEIYSRCYKESPLVIQGAGAGNDTTAAGVLADIVDLQDLF